MATRTVAAAHIIAYAGCDKEGNLSYEAIEHAERSYCYDEHSTWSQNIANGLPKRCRDLPPSERCWAPEDKWVNFLNHKLASPFGVAAGPLLNSHWIELAASRGFDCLTYKTIRSHYHAGHGLPNILHLQVDEQLPASGPACQEPLFTRLGLPHGASQSSKAALKDGPSYENSSEGAHTEAPTSADAAQQSGPPASSPQAKLFSTSARGGGCGAGAGGGGMLAITNSFGMPSLGPEELAEDLPAAAAALRPGQMMVVSITGTPGRPGLSFSEDLHLAARTALAGGATALEVNLSCPNVGASHVALYQDGPAVESLLAGLTEVVAGAAPLMIKVGSFPDKDPEGLRRVLQAAERAGAAAVAGINGLSRRVELPGGGGPALGPDRPTSGVCGDPIRAAGLDFVTRARQVIAADNLRLGLVGVGGVTQADHVMEYLEAGADVVQSATGFMWRPNLGFDFQRLWAAAGYTVHRADGRGCRG